MHDSPDSSRELWALADGKTIDATGQSFMDAGTSASVPSLFVSGGAKIINSGSFTFAPGIAAQIQNVDPAGAASAFMNDGTVNVSPTSPGAKLLFGGMEFNNDASGTVNVNAGLLALDAGGTSSGTFNVMAGASLEFGGNTTLTSASTSQITGAGTVDFVSANATIGATYDTSGS